MPQSPSLEPSPSMLTEAVKATFKDAGQKLTGSRKRNFMAKVTQDYLDGSARRAETVFGWNRHSVQLGLHEHRTGMVCVDNYRARGRDKTEEKLSEDMKALVRALAVHSIWAQVGLLDKK